MRRTCKSRTTGVLLSLFSAALGATLMVVRSEAHACSSSFKQASKGASTGRRSANRGQARRAPLSHPGRDRLQVQTPPFTGFQGAIPVHSPH
jgi:hypothetical protein